MDNLCYPVCIEKKKKKSADTKKIVAGVKTKKRQRSSLSHAGEYVCLKLEVFCWFVCNNYTTKIDYKLAKKKIDAARTLFFNYFGCGLPNQRSNTESASAASDAYEPVI